MSDFAFSADDTVKAVVALLLAAHAGAFAWYMGGREMAPVRWLNLLVSGGVVVLWLPHLGRIFDYVAVVPLFAAFAFAVFTMSVAAVLSLRVPRAAIWAAFAANAILTAAALVFFFTFKMTRLF